MATNVSGLVFNGTTRYLTLTQNATLKNMTAFTWMAWVKAASTNFSENDTPYKRLYVERQGTGKGIRFGVVPMQGRLRFEFSPKDGTTDTNYDFKYTWDRRWHHVAFVARISGSDPTYETYLDGLLVAEGKLVVPAGTTAISNTNPMGGKIYVGNASYHTSGGDVFASDTYWDGYLDEIIIFNQAKSQGDILSYYASDDTWDMADTDMFSYWRFDENTGTSTTDAENGAWTGTLQSSNMWTVDRPFIGNGNSDTTVPSTPTLPGSPTTNVTADAFTATWVASTDNVAIQGYELHVALVSDFSAYTTYETTMGTLSRTVTGLLPATNYYWRVRAFDAENNFSGYPATQSLTTSSTGDITPPVAPTNLTSSLITHSTFRVNWTASASSDEAGYKIDVATDVHFTQYLVDHRNKDIGNVTQFDVVGTDPLTTYYVRLRAYDAVDNEGGESVVLVVQTVSIPDTTPPLPVVLLSPTSIESHALTANWEETYDDVGVVYYELDVSSEDDFSTFLTIGSTTYQGLNVGNVTSYRITGLSSEQTIYYRVRAVDGSGNESANIDEMDATTTPSNIDEGGFIRTLLAPTADAWTDSASTSTNHGTDTALEVAGNGASATRVTHLQFDLTGTTGTIVSAVLSLYVQNTSVDTITVVVDNVTFDELTINWSNQPSPGGATLFFVPSAVGQWVSIDLSSLFLDGPAIYDIRLTTTSADNFIFDSREGTNIPTLEVEVDPNTATTVDPEFDFHDSTFEYINYIKNPSFEDGTTNFWSAVGSTPATISNVANAYNGTKGLQVTCSGAVSGQGVRYAINDAEAEEDQYWAAGIAIKRTSGSGQVLLHLREYSSGGSLLNGTTLVIDPSTEWQRVGTTRLFNQATTAFATIEIVTQSATAQTFILDSAVLVGGHHHPVPVPAYFDGNTSGGAWIGTANASRSRLNAVHFHYETTYTGDGNEDNSVVAKIKRGTHDEWLTLPSYATEQDRTTKRVSTGVGPSYGPYNYIKNPSFEINTTNWGLHNPNANATLTRDTEYSDEDAASGKLTWGTGAGSAAFSNSVYAVVGQTWTARASVYIPFGVTARIRIAAFTSAFVYIAESTPIAGITDIVGDDTWHTLYVTYTLPATTALINVAISCVSSDAGHFYFDAVQLTQTSEIGPYIDGDSADGIWEGDEHASFSSYFISPLKNYYVRHDYSDPDGLTQATADDVYTIATDHVTGDVLDNVTTGLSIVLTASPVDIRYVVTYAGDDNDDNSVTIFYKRTDLTNWTNVKPSYNREAKVITGTIDDLNPGTNYTVRVIFSDPDGVLGESTMYQAVTTLTNFGSPQTESTITFDGFVLMGRSDGKIGVSRHDAFGLPDRRVQIESLPRVDGAIELQNLWDRRPISMTGFVDGETRAELEDNKNALKRALAPKQKHLVIDTLSTHGRYYTATCESLAIAEVGGENIRHLVWDADFICADPFAYETTLTEVPEFVVTNGATSTVSNLGDLRIDPYIMIKTSHTKSITLTVTNVTTGERITPRTTILNGDTLVIDTNKLAVLKNGVEVDYAGSFPHLAVGANQFLYTLTSATTPSIRVAMSWRHRFL